MKQYIDLCNKVLAEGRPRTDRTGTGTLGIFGYTMRFNLQEGFPAVTTKKLAFKTMTNELLWFLRGDTDVRNLQEVDCHIWDSWGDDIGPMYGYQWRSFNGEECDQLLDVIHSLKTDPHSRRHIMTSFNPLDKDKGVLYPCHGISIQFYVEDGKLSCMTHQRSGDIFLGVPFNIASYSLLTHIVAELCGYKVGELIYTIGDAHIYNNHIELVKEQVSRAPYELPQLSMDVELDTQDFIKKLRAENFELQGYEHHPSIKGKVSV